MNYTSTEKKLLKELEDMEIVDAHEHLPPEPVRTSAKVDVLTLFSHYTGTDIITSGMSPGDHKKLFDHDIPLEQRWKLFRPYLDHIRFGSYSRPAFIVAKDFYGHDDITDDNYKELSERIAEDNKPGIYKKILRDKCNIRVCLTQSGRTDYDLDLLIPLMPMGTYWGIKSLEDLKAKSEELGVDVSDLESYLVLARKGIEKWKSEGAVGLKMASRPTVDLDRKIAENVLKKILKGEDPAEMEGSDHLRDFLMHQLMDIAAELDIVVAVHSGMWGDFRTLDSKHMISIFPQHPDTRFDLYHMGMPSVRDTGVIGKNFPNVWLNLCWCHIISPKMTCSALDEWIDLVPMNKIIGFGGDYGHPVEKVYGHLKMAREDIALVLGGRIDRGLMKFEDAVSIARRWLWENPKGLYKLNI